MSRHFKDANRDQLFLLPPSINDWVGEGHLVRFLYDCVKMFDLSPFYNAYKREGGPPYEPEMMLTVMLYAWCHGIKSSRKIAEACMEHVALRWAVGNQHPDHCAFARFFQRHGEAIKDLFVQVLYLCHQVGALRIGQLYLDGTKIAGNASMSANRTLDHIRKEIERIEEEMKKQDASESSSGSEGKELPRALRSQRERLARLRAAMERLETELALKAKAAPTEESEKEDKRGKEKEKVPRANVTDPDSRVMMARQGCLLQGFNAQAVVTKDQFVVALDVVNDQNDLHLLEKMLSTVFSTLEAAGIEERPKMLGADAGYWLNSLDVAGLEQEGPELLIATCNQRNQPKKAPRGRIPRSASSKERMTRKLSTKAGQEKYKKRGVTVEPVFGQIKECLDGRRFLRRGIEKVRREWSLLCSCLDLRKLFSWLRKRKQTLAEALG